MLAGERDDVAATIDAALNYALTAWAQARAAALGARRHSRPRFRRACQTPQGFEQSLGREGREGRENSRDGSRKQGIVLLPPAPADA